MVSGLDVSDSMSEPFCTGLARITDTGRVSSRGLWCAPGAATGHRRHLALAGGEDFVLQDHVIESVVFELPFGRILDLLNGQTSFPYPFGAQFAFTPACSFRQHSIVACCTDPVDAAPASSSCAASPQKHHKP